MRIKQSGTKNVSETTGTKWPIVGGLIIGISIEGDERINGIQILS